MSIAGVVAQLKADMRAVCAFDAIMRVGASPEIVQRCRTDPELRRIAEMWADLQGEASDRVDGA